MCIYFSGNPGTIKEAESKYKSINSDMMKEKLTNQTYPVIQFLGTGSGESNLHRNCPCILIQEYYFHLIIPSPRLNRLKPAYEICYSFLKTGMTVLSVYDILLDIHTNRPNNTYYL